MRTAPCASAQSDQLFVVRSLDSMIAIAVLFKISRHKLVSVAERAGLCLTWSQIPEDRFSRDEEPCRLRHLSSILWNCYVKNH